MMNWVSIAFCCALAAPSPSHSGVIEGVVLNGSQHQSPVHGAVVVLRADHQGRLLPIAESVSDDEGRFRFEQLPVTGDLVCLPGANYQGVHYPGRRVSLDGRRPVPDQRIVVYETVADPSPLVAARHEIDIRLETGVLVATETIIVANRTLRSYVGSETAEGQPSVTLRLSIPSEFEKVTFEKEFFGRQFQLNNGNLETQIPWTPGQRELKFTYRLPFEHRQWLFRRALDLPTEHIRVTVGGQTEDVTCNLLSARTLQGNAIVFDSEAAILPAGYTVELQIGDLPVSWTAYARWSALAALVLLLLGTCAFMFWRRRTLPMAETAGSIEPKARDAMRAA
jgi:hypothetical protein